MTIEDVKKICTECGKPKDIKLFHRNHLKKDGRATKCAKCLNKAGRQGTKDSQNATGVKIRLPKNKIICDRNNREIFKKDCIPGCNDACMVCENAQMKNVRAGSDTLTPEEDKEAMIAGTWGSSSAIAVNEGHSEL